MTRTSAPPHHYYFMLKSWADEKCTDRRFRYKLPRLLVRLILISAAEFNNNALSLRSAALTYTVLLSLVPILAMSAALVKGLGGDNQLRKAAYSYIETLADKNAETAKQSTPAAAPATTESPNNGGNLTDHLRAAVDQLFDYVDKTDFATLGTFGVVGILLSVILVLSYIEEAMNGIWKVARGRSLSRKIADYLTLLILLPISINVAFAAGAMVQLPALLTKIDILIPFPWLQTLLLKGVPVAIITLTFYVMYIFFPNTRVKALPALFGAGLAAFLWTLVQDIYITLQIGVANYNAIYGSFATLPLFLVWIYLGWLFILTGAQVAYACQNMERYRLLPAPAVPSLQLGAAFDIMDCITSAFAEAKAIRSDNLAEYLPHYQPTIINEIATKLQETGLLHVSQSDNRLLPASLGKSDDYRALVAIVLGNDTADSSGGARSKCALAAAAEACSTAPSSSSGGG